MERDFYLPKQPKTLESSYTIGLYYWGCYGNCTELHKKGLDNWSNHQGRTPSALDTYPPLPHIPWLIAF